MKKWKKYLLIFLVFVLCLATFGYFKISNLAKESISSIEIENLDLSSVKDGTYIGQYYSNPCAAKLKVTVKNHKIKDIEILEHQKGLGGKAESILDDVIENQSLNVDTVSGATLSSKVLLKSIENAIIEGVK